MATLIPFTAQLTMLSPPMAGLPDCPLPLTFVSAFTHRAAYRLEYTGTGTKTLDLGSLAAGVNATGAKFLIFTVDADISSAALPVLVGFDTVAAPSLEISQGGWVSVASPKPTAAGVLTVKLTWSSSFKGYIWVLG